MTSSVRLSKWGNSVGVRLPKYVVDALGLKPGLTVDVSLENDHRALSLIIVLKRFGIQNNRGEQARRNGLGQR